jgi:hypothetical protein
MRKEFHAKSPRRKDAKKGWGADQFTVSAFFGRLLRYGLPAPAGLSYFSNRSCNASASGLIK